MTTGSTIELVSFRYVSQATAWLFISALSATFLKPGSKKGNQGEIAIIEAMRLPFLRSCRFSNYRSAFCGVRVGLKPKDS